MPKAAHAQSLIEALSEAYNTNNRLRASRAQQRATEEGIPVARAAGYPTLNADVSYGYTYRETVSPSFFNPDISTTSKTEISPWSVSINLTQPLYQGGAILGGVRRAETLARSGQLSLIDTEQQILLSAVQAYMGVVRETEVLALRRANIQIMQQSFARTRAQLEVGEVTSTDLAQAQSRMEGAKASFVAAQSALVRAQATYEEIIGSPPGDVFLPPVPPLPLSQEETKELTLRQNPQLGATIFAEQAARLGVSTARGALLPSINVTGTYSYGENVSQKGDQSETLSVSLRARVPLYQGGGAYARTRQAKQRLQQAQWDTQHTLRQLERQIINVWQNLLTARAQIQHARAQIRAQKSALEGVKREAELGARTTLDVLDAEREYVNAQVTLVTAKHDEQIAAYSILSLIGMLTARQLDLPVDFYDQNAHYNSVRFKWFGLFAPSFAPSEEIFRETPP